MRGLKSLVLITLLISSDVVCSQEKPPLEELMRWFPEGSYSEVIHFDRDLFLRSCPKELLRNYAQAARQLFPAGKGILPDSMVDRFESVTTAVKGEARFKNNYIITAGGEIKQVNRKCAIVVEANDRYYGAWMATRSLRVYRFADLETLVKNAMKLGEINVFEERINKHPVYVCRPGGTDGELYAFATPTQEFLVAEDPDVLKAMVQAGMLGGSAIFSGTDLSGLIEVSSDLGYFWKFWTPNALIGMTLNYLYKKDPASPSIKPLEDQLDADVQCIVEDYRWNIDGNRVQRTSVIFGNENRVGEEYRLIKQGKGHYYEALHHTYIYGRDISFRHLLNRINEKRALSTSSSEIVLDGDRIIITRADDQDTLKRILAAYTTFEK